MPKKKHSTPPPVKPKSKAAPKRRQHAKQKSVELQDRRTEIAALYVKGYFQFEIAEALGITAAQVNRDLKSIQAEWAETRVEDLQLAKQKELAKLEQVEREAWQAWDRSQKDAVTEKRTAGEIEATTSKDGKPGESIELPVTKTETTRAGQVGDPRYLDQVQKVVERRCKLLGLDAPAKIQTTGEFQTLEQILADIVAAVSN